MKKTAFALALLVAVSSCNNNNQETSTPTTNNETSAPLSNEVPAGEEVNIAEVANQPLNKGAEKFKGEFKLSADDGVKALIRDHPEKPGLLAFTLYIGNHDPRTLEYWYNEKEDVLSSKTSKGQPTFTILRLDPTGKELESIHHDWNKNRTDTTVYNRLR